MRVGFHTLVNTPNTSYRLTEGGLSRQVAAQEQINKQMEANRGRDSTSLDLRSCTNTKSLMRDGHSHNHSDK